MNILTRIHQFLCKYSLMGHDCIKVVDGNVLRLECLKCGEKTCGWH